MRTAVKMNATERASSLEGFRDVIFVWAMTQTVLIIAANISLLVFSCKIPDQTRNPLHVLYTFLGVADLVNGFYCFILSVSYYFTEIELYHHFCVCFFIVTLHNAGITTTGYTLLLLSLMKCISIMYPLKSLRYITQHVVIFSSIGVWIFSYLVIVLPSVYWNVGKFHGTVDQCNMNTVYDENHKDFSNLGLFLGIGFSVCFFGVNVVTVYSISKQGRKVGNLTSEQDSSKTEGIPPQSTDDLAKTSKTARTSSMCPTTNSQKVKTFEYSPVLNKRQRRNYYNFKKSRNFKAYITVLFHTLVYMACGLPVLILMGYEELSWYYYNDRNARYIATLFMYMTSLVNPLLTIFRIPVFQKIAKSTASKMKRKCL